MPQYALSSACCSLWVYRSTTARLPVRSCSSILLSSVDVLSSGSFSWLSFKTGSLHQPLVGIGPFSGLQTMPRRGRSFCWSFSSSSLSGLLRCIVWVAAMLLFRFLSKEHSWILPVFGLSIGAPRWAQVWWGTSNIGYYLPWAGSLTSGALVSRCLWLWLGVLDEIQQVGLGMILLQTLTRAHVCFVLLAAQALGSIATICARAFAPNNVGPAGVSPNVGSSIDKVGNAWFWVSLFFQLLARSGFTSLARTWLLTDFSQLRLSAFLPPRTAQSSLSSLFFLGVENPKKRKETNG